MNLPLHLERKGISLEHIGVNEVAWIKDDALDLLKYLELNDSFVLGGDVLVLEPDGYRYNYDNWYFNLEDGDANESIEHTRNFIKNYPSGNYAFVLVIAQ
jgi:hypothetical protein